MGFLTSEYFVKLLEVKIGQLFCENAQVIDSWTIVCILPAGTGQKLQVQVIFNLLEQTG